MAFFHLTAASSGATRNSGTNGDFCTLLDWALNTTCGWAIEYTASNNRVYRPVNGNRNRLFVCHDSATTGNAGLALVRGCENATAAGIGTITNPFPTTTQRGNTLSNWLISSTANTTDRPFHIWCWDTAGLGAGIIYASNFSSASDVWDIGWYADLAGTDPADIYATAIGVRASSGVSSVFSAVQVLGVLSGGQSPSAYFARDISGLILSTLAQIEGPTSNTLVNPAAINGTPPARSGFANRVRRRKAAVSCYGNTNNTATDLAMIDRGWIPYLWLPLHNGLGSLHDNTTVLDNADNSIVLQPIPTAAGTGSAFILVQSAGSWAAPT